jgi:glutamate-ammonia-ligase adenylyltransferase
VQTLTHDLTTTIGGLDYEAQLDATRRWQKDWHFRIGVHHLRGLITPHDAAIQYSDLADAVLAGLWPCVCDEIARRHGPAPGRGGVVIGMGSLGAKAMTARSDLDLIVIYDADGVETSNGARPLETRRWYAKATKGLITALTAPTAAGKLYDADLRLRPSGQQGPVATSLTAFRTYQAHEAWTWEHMALTRARAVAGPQDLQTAFENARHAVLSHPHSHHKVLADLRDMRARLQMAEHATDIWAIKDGAGGLKDLDLLAQATGLMANATDRTTPLQLAAAAQAGLLDDRICKALIAAQMLYVTVMQSGFLVAEGRLSPDMLGEQGGRFLAQQAGLADVKALASQLGQTRSQIAHIIDEICATAS